MTDDMTTPQFRSRALERSSPAPRARPARARARMSRLYRDIDRPLAPLVRHVSAHLPGSLVLGEPVERLAGVGHLKGPSGPRAGAETRGVHAGPSRGRSHAGG